jgi:endonuclease YncB( thermonuclease family)
MAGPGKIGRRGARRSRSRDGGLRIVVLLLIALLGLYGYRLWTAAPPVSLVGRAHVVDGDSLEIRGARIRLEGVDAPELEQSCADARGQSWSCGRTAAHELRSFLRGHDLRCEALGRDRFERTLAVCELPDGENVNAWLVRQGWALSSGRSGKYQTEQDEAQAAGRGIWAGTFEAPWEWRQNRPQ